MDSLISTFHIDWKLMVAQLINFAVVLLVLWIFALKPLKKLMDERGATIEGGLENAKKQAELLAAQQTEYDAMLSKARSDAAALMNEVKVEAEARRGELLAQAKTEADNVIANGKKELAAEKSRILEEAKKELIGLVTSATEKVLGSAITEKVEKTLVENSIKDMA